MSLFDNLVRPEIKALKAYSARGGATHAIHLDANEAPFPPPPGGRATERYNLYPEQQPPALVQRLAQIYDVAPDYLMVGRGADEGLEVLSRVIGRPGEDRFVISTPTFGYYKTVTDIQGCDTVDVPLKADFSYDTEGVITEVQKDTARTKAVFVCTPNNPTGNLIPEADILKLCQSCPDTLIVVDEAYIDFADVPSLARKIPETENLVVLRTLSKAYALAGVRCGVMMAHPDLIQTCLKVLPPYPVPRPVEDTVLKTLAPQNMAIHASRTDNIIAERERVYKALQGSEFIEAIWPSQTNFLLLKAKDEDRLLKNLSLRTLKIRDFRSARDGWFRLTIGSEAENNLALEAFGVAPVSVKLDRTAEAFRDTNETKISISVNLDNNSRVDISTGNGFFDHMLEQVSRHGGFGLVLQCEGDHEVDAHHTVEDCALALGSALKDALGNKAGIGRYGFVMPMDETLAKVAIDLSGRPAAEFKGEFPSAFVGEFPSEMCPHFFASLAQTLGAAIHIDVAGDNTHHMIEACFKGVGRALRPALAVGNTMDIPSTKGVL